MNQEMKGKDLKSINTFGELKESGYQVKKIKDELRDNLKEKIKKGERVFNHILGFDHSVLPDVERAILSRHNINLLGLRGQAKTSIARAMVDLLDEYIPIVSGSELNDDPFAPISRYAKDLIAEKGDKTPISWMHRSERYGEKLATPDVTVADLIGDVDPIKAANLGLNYSDEKVIHFGIVPNSNRSIFVINELPDLQPRIQVALFNILQEGDIQIRGFKMRLPLDIHFVFTANPEDYTNRGSIITPLKDRIQSQIITHYPKSVEISRQITRQEASLSDDQRKSVVIPELMEELLEYVSFEARESELIDQKSGVSTRLSITAYENLVSTAERRNLINNEHGTAIRIGDLYGVIPAITGKVELVYEGEQEGALNVAYHLIGKAIRKILPKYFPNPERLKKRKEPSAYEDIIEWFGRNELDLLHDMPYDRYKAELYKVDGLEGFVNEHREGLSEEEKLLNMELVLHGLAEYSMLSKNLLEKGLSFNDLLNSVFSVGSNFDEED